MHECLIEKRLDYCAYREQYMIRCRCHEDAFHIWQPGDPEYVCPKERLKKEENA